MKKTTMVLLSVGMLLVVLTVLVQAAVPDAGDAPFLTGYEVITDTTPQDSSGWKDIMVTCPPGKFVIGGGARIFGSINGTALTTSGPEGTPSQPNQWYAVAQEVMPSNNSWGLRVDVFCASAVSDYQVITQSSDSNNDTLKTATAVCPQGTSVISGGARIFGTISGTMLSTSGPEGTPSQPHEWYAVAQKMAASKLPWGLRVDVFCANLPGYEVITDSSVVNNGQVKSASPICPAGKLVVGGGARIFGTIDGTGLTVSGPEGTPSMPDEWFAGGLAHGMPNFPDWGVRGDVFCAREQVPPLPCYHLQLSHHGEGLDPVANPDASPDCPPGHYQRGQFVELMASPADGWRVGGWQGTLDDTSQSIHNEVVMPPDDHQVIVFYEPIVGDQATFLPLVLNIN